MRSHSWAFTAGHRALSCKGHHQVWNGGPGPGQPCPRPGGGRLAQAPETHGLVLGSLGPRSGRPHPLCSLPAGGDLLAPSPAPHCRLEEAPWTGGHAPGLGVPSSPWGEVPPGSPASISNQPRGHTARPDRPETPPARGRAVSPRSAPGGWTRVPPGSSSSWNSKTVPSGRGQSEGDVTTITDVGGEVLTAPGWLGSGLRAELRPQGTAGDARFDGTCSPRSFQQPRHGTAVPRSQPLPSEGWLCTGRGHRARTSERQALPGEASQSPIRDVNRQMKRRARDLTPGPRASASDFRASLGLDAIVTGTWL